MSRNIRVSEGYKLLKCVRCGIDFEAALDRSSSVPCGLCLLEADIAKQRAAAYERERKRWDVSDR